MLEYSYERIRLKTMKYTKILAILIVLFYLYQFVEAIVKHGLPRYPIYYVASIVEAILGYLTVRFMYTPLAKRRPFLVLLIVVFSIGIPVTFYYWNVDSLWQMSGSHVWFFISGMVSWSFTGIKKMSTLPGLSDSAQIQEEGTKGIVLLILTFIIILVAVMLIMGVTFLFVT